MIYLSALLISMFITISLVPVLRSTAARFKLVDMPNPRKVHNRAVPKVGGIAMAIGALVPILTWLEADPFVRSLLTSMGILIIVGIIDDVQTLGYKTKFLGQCVAAIIIVLWGGVEIRSLGDINPFSEQMPVFLSIPLTLFVIIGVTNAINLSDGLDGLAGGISMLSFICLGYMAYCSGELMIAIICIAVIGSIFGFLRFNTYPATIFMGDTGSQLLGFIAVTLSLKITQGNTPYSPLLPLMLLGFPILDTLAVMTERISKKRSPFVADKNHFHHKLMRLGLFHTEAVFIIYILQALLVTSAYLLRFHSDWLLLFSYILFSSGIVAGFVVADVKSWQIKRYDVFDLAIKGKLKVLKQKQIPIRVLFRVVQFGLPLLLIITIMLPKKIPGFFPYYAMALAAALSWSALFRKAVMGGIIRIGLYMTVPFLVYLSVDRASGVWANPPMEHLYGISFVLLAVCIILTLKFTRRQRGFKSTPMDFLILFIALIVPNLPGLPIMNHSLGAIAIRVIVFLFGYEVLLGELRSEYDSVAVTTISALIILSLRGWVFSA